MNYIKLGFFPEIATLPYTTFIRHRDDCLREFHSSYAEMLLVHHTDLTELVSFDKEVSDDGLILARQTCCPEAVRGEKDLYFWFDDDWYECVASKSEVEALSRVYVNHNISTKDIHKYIMTQLQTPNQYALQLGYTQSDLIKLAPEIYRRNNMDEILEFIYKRSESV